jgi:hypothetical protein
MPPIQRLRLSESVCEPELSHDARGLESFGRLRLPDRHVTGGPPLQMQPDITGRLDLAGKQQVAGVIAATACTASPGRGSFGDTVQAFE